MAGRMECRGCGERFTSLAAFDAHRSGRYGTHETGWTGWLERWCVPPAEVKDDNGPILRRLEDGAWEHAEDADRGRERFRRIRQENGEAPESTLDV